MNRYRTLCYLRSGYLGEYIVMGRTKADAIIEAQKRAAQVHKLDRTEESLITVAFIGEDE